MTDFTVQFNDPNDDLQTSFDSAPDFNVEFAGLTMGGGGTSDHTQLTNRDAENQHPMSAITSLTDVLDDLDNWEDGLWDLAALKRAYACGVITKEQYREIKALPQKGQN